MPDELTIEAQEFLEEHYPPEFHRSYLLQAIAAAAAPEVTLLNENIDMMERNLIAASLDEEAFVARFEELLGLTVNPDETLQTRVRRARAFVAIAGMSASALDWRKVADFLAGIEYTYEVVGAEYNTLEFVVPYPNGSTQQQLLAALLRAITPAVMIINVTDGPGFNLDSSLLDVDTL